MISLGLDLISSRSWLLQRKSVLCAINMVQIVPQSDTMITNTSHRAVVVFISIQHLTWISLQKELVRLVTYGKN